MASADRGPSAWSWGYGFLGQSAWTSRVVKAPPIKGQSASTKQSTPRTGTSAAKGCADHVDLLEHAVHQLGAVAGSDEQPFYAGAQDPAFDLEVRAAAVLLRVDDIDAVGRHGDVVDVCLGPEYPSVVQQLDGVACQAVQASAQPLFTNGTGVPGGRGLPLLGDGKEEASDPWMLGPDALLTLGFATLELPTSGCSGVPGSTTSMAAGSVWSRFQG